MSGIDLDNLSFKDVDKYVEQHENELLQKELYLDKDLGIVPFDVIKNFGLLSERKSAPSFALVNWNGNIRYDIRRWNSNMSRPGKGITFTEMDIKVILASIGNSYEAQLGRTVMACYESGKAKATIYENICKMSEFELQGVKWSKEINIVDWGYGIKVDMRKWAQGYEKCSKGISITLEEFKRFVDILKETTNCSNCMSQLYDSNC